MEGVFNYVRVLLWAQHYGLIITIGLVVLAYVGHRLFYSAPSHSAKENMAMVLEGTSTVLCILFFPGWLGAVCTNDYTLSDIVAREAAVNPIVVVEKKDSQAYSDYKLSCGRVNWIYARIHKFDEYSDANLYCAEMNNHKARELDKLVQFKIERAVAEYNLYSKGKDN